jgi:hypothetical protein
MTDDLGSLPDTVHVTQSFIARIPSQRILDTLSKLEPHTNFGQLVEQQVPRLIAFRKLLRDFPERDMTSLWLHAYDVEVEVVEVDPTNGSSPTRSPPSATTGTASPPTSTP